jgi:hypothetical protein
VLSPRSETPRVRVPLRAMEQIVHRFWRRNAIRSRSENTYPYLHKHLVSFHMAVKCAWSGGPALSGTSKAGRF